MDVVELTKRLIEIPSYVGESNDEAAVAAFLAALLSTDERLAVTTEEVLPGRHNVIATTPGPSSLMLAGHIDTVVPCSGWRVNPFSAAVEDGRLYGLGSLDMKAGVAAIVSAVLAAEALPAGLTVLLYCDEEYDFSGMRSFLTRRSELQLDERPALVVIAEPSEEQIWNSHRGIIELKLCFTGRSAHAARPDNGINAIAGSIAACENVKAQLLANPSDTLGVSTMNIAGVTGGVRDDDGRVVVQANAVPDYAEVLVDVRTASVDLDAARLTQLITEAATASGVALTDTEVHHDLGALLTPPSELRELEAAIEATGLPVTYADGSVKGFGDGQLLRDAWAVPVANFGPSGSGMHASDEYVDVDSLNRTKSVYDNLLRQFCL